MSSTAEINATRTDASVMFSDAGPGLNEAPQGASGNPPAHAKDLGAGGDGSDARAAASGDAAGAAMGDAPEVSVLVIGRNMASYMRLALLSIHGQTLTDLEVVVVDDGSADQTAREVQWVQAIDRRIRLVRLPQPVGEGAAAQAGLAHCRAPVVARLGAADLATPNRLMAQLAFFRSVRSAGVVASGTAVDLVDGAGRRLRTLHPPLEHAEIRNGLLRRERVLWPSGLMLDAAAAREAGGYDPAYRAAADIDLCLRLAERGRLANQPEVLQRCRFTPDATRRRDGEAVGDGTVTRASALMDERLGRTGAAWSPRLRSPVPWAHATFLHENHLGLTQSATFADNVLWLLLERPDGM